MIFNHIGLGFGGGVAVTAVLSSLLFLYVIYDVIVFDEMIIVEKLIWIVLSATTGFIGISIYLYLVKYRGEFIADHADLETVQSNFTGNEVDELERLSKLKEKGDLSEEEFEQKKAEILGNEKS